MEAFQKPPPHWGVFKAKAPTRQVDDLREDRVGCVDGILVLAGGLDEEFNVHPFVQHRLDAAAQLFYLHEAPIVCLGGGTYHKPTPVNSFGHVIHESTACAQHLVDRGIAPCHIYKEWASYDTIANGLFAFQHFILPLDMKRVVVITSDFHMARTQVIFEHMRSIHGHTCEIIYYATHDDMADSETLRQRQAREESSRSKYIETVASKHTTLAAFIKWFYVEHACYNAQPRKDELPISTILKTSY